MLVYLKWVTALLYFQEITNITDSILLEFPNFNSKAHDIVLLNLQNEFKANINIHDITSIHSKNVMRIILKPI